MFVTIPRGLVIERVENKRLRIKNGDAFFTGFLSKKLPPLPDSVTEGSQVSVSGFIKATLHEKYGLQYSMTITAVIELGSAGTRSKSKTEVPEDGK